jgi:hypothetical protein
LTALEEVTVTSFIALYRGETVSEARIVALSADPQLVRDFAARLLESPPEPHTELEPPSGDIQQQVPRVVKLEDETVGE